MSIEEPSASRWTVSPPRLDVGITAVGVGRKGALQLQYFKNEKKRKPDRGLKETLEREKETQEV